MADAEDKKVIDLIRAQDKDTADFLDQLLSSGKFNYPIQDEKAFVEAAGGANTKFTVGGKNVTLGSLMGKTPAYYFPIADEHELVAKLADIAFQQRSPAPNSAAAGKLMAATGDKPPNPRPEDRDDEHEKSKKANPGQRVGGIKKKG